MRCACVWVRSNWRDGDNRKGWVGMEAWEEGAPATIANLTRESDSEKEERKGGPQTVPAKGQRAGACMYLPK